MSLLAAGALAVLCLSWLPLLGTAGTPGHELSRGWAGVVRQTRNNTCGPAVLATLLLAGGAGGTELGIAAAADLGPEGVSLAEFGRLATSLGIPGAWYAAGSAPPERLRVPFVAHLEQPAGHFVLVTAVGAGLVQLSDPARGRLALTTDRFSALWSGRAWFFHAPAG